MYSVTRVILLLVMLLAPVATHRQVDYFCPQSEDHTVLSLPVHDAREECSRDENGNVIQCTLTRSIDIHGCWKD